MEPNTQFTPPVLEPEPLEQQPMDELETGQISGPDSSPDSILASDPQFERPVDPEPVFVEPVQLDPEKKSKKSIIGRLLLVVLILLLIAGGVGAYLWRDNQATIQKSNDATEISNLNGKVIELEKAAEAAEQEATATEGSLLTTAEIASIEASITSQNTAVLEGYMADKLNVTKSTLETVVDRTPAQSISDLSYIDNAISPWNFEIESATLAKYAAGDYATYFKDDSIVGQSSNKYVIVLNFNSLGKINSIFMSDNSDILSK